MKPRFRGERGLSMLEIMVAASLLSVVMLAVMSAAATGQRAVAESSDQVIATNTARNYMEQLLEADWQTQLLPYYQNYLNRTYVGGAANPPNFFPVPIPGEPPITALDPLNPALPANKLGTLVVREPTLGEVASYNSGAPHIPQAPRFSAIPMPPAGPTLLMLIVTVDTNTPAPTFPWARSPKPGRGRVFVEFRSLRSFL